MYLSAAVVIDLNQMEWDYSGVLLGDMFAKPYGEYFVNDSITEALSFGSPGICSHCGDVIDSLIM